MVYQGFSGSNIYECAGSGSVDSHLKAEPCEQRGLALHTLACRLQKREAKFNPYMVACNFIGYFILSAPWPFSGSVSFKFPFPAKSSPPPHYNTVLLCQHRLASKRGGSASESQVLRLYYYQNIRNLCFI
jgi:hypothetical protein